VSCAPQSESLVSAMPIFKLSDGSMTTVKRTDFANEKELQTLLENNLQEVFGCRFVGSEFTTGSVHSGRIDSLALSEDGNPVIIEYKKTEDSKLINQALFYLDWIKDHKGDFELAVQKTLGNVVVQWEQIRVICIAPSYDRYALHAVKHMGVSLELWKYSKYDNGTLELEEVFRSADGPKKSGRGDSKARTTSAPEKTNVSFDYHLAKAAPEIQSLVQDLSDFLCSLELVAEVPQKQYIAYKVGKNIATMEVQKKRAILYLPLSYDSSMPDSTRDLTGVGHWGTGDLEVKVSSADDLETAYALITRSYNEHGGH
jgi:predicted transport protein